MSMFLRFVGMISCLAIFISAPAHANPAVLDCIFLKPSLKNTQPVVEELAIFAPNWPSEVMGNDFEAVDPSNLLNGKRFNAFKKGSKEGSYALIEFSPGNLGLLMSFNQKTDGPIGLFTVMLGNRSTKLKPLMGQCGAVGEKPRELFDFWKANPDKIGQMP